MKRKLAPRGMTLPRSSLWRFTYSLINVTSSSCGKKCAFKPEPSSSRQNSQSHTFQTTVCARGSLWAHNSRARRLGVSMVHWPWPGQCARAGPPQRPANQRGGAVQARLAPPPREWREKDEGNPELREGSWKLSAELTTTDA